MPTYSPEYRLEVYEKTLQRIHEREHNCHDDIPFLCHLIRNVSDFGRMEDFTELNSCSDGVYAWWGRDNISNEEHYLLRVLAVLSSIEEVKKLINIQQ